MHAFFCSGSRFAIALAMSAAFFLIGPTAAFAGDDAAATRVDSLMQPAGDQGIVECQGVGWRTPAIPVSDPVVLPSSALPADVRAEAIEVNYLPMIDTAALLEEDADTPIGRPLRVGVPRELPNDLNGQWFDLPDGGRLWMASIRSHGAKRTRLYITNMALPPGDALYVYSPTDMEHVFGPYTEAGPNDSGDLRPGSTSGDTVVVEYRALSDGQFVTPFKIEEISHMYKGEVREEGVALPRAWDSCMVDVACYSAWEDVSYSVARMSFQSWDDPGCQGCWYNCSGTLLATQNNDNTPYFLTSAHCVDETDEADTLECLWFYQAATCGGALMSMATSLDAEVLATNGGEADWSLLMIKGVLPAGVFWSGWTNAAISSGTWSVAVHHPNGEVKRYSRGQRFHATSNLHGLDWDVAGGVGQIYYGTSGSGIFRESDQLLYGNASVVDGVPGCDHMSTNAYYGRFDTYYATISSLLASGSDDALEQNDTCAAARALSIGSWTDLVVKNTDEDWYAVTLDDGNQLTATLTFTDSYGDIDAELYDSCGGSVVASATTSTNNETLTYVNNSGSQATFYLRVFLYDDTRNTYNMTLAWGDATPPTPDPMTWDAPPAPAGTTSITMTATLAVDDNFPVEYAFYTGSGAAQSGWVSNRVYTKNGLSTNFPYSYKVKARDTSVHLNETAFSTPDYWSATAIQTPTGITFANVGDTEMDVTASGVFSNLNFGDSGLYFEMTPAAGSGANVWTAGTTSTTVHVSGLTPGQTYTFRVKARNYYGSRGGAYETPYTTTFQQATSGGGPTCTTTFGDVNTDTLVNGADIAGFVRAKLGLPPEGGENQACADNGGSVEDDITDFIDILLN